MKRHSFFVRLFLGNLVIVVVAVLAAAVVSYRAVNDQHLRVANAYQDNLCLIAAQYLEDLWPLPDDRIDAVCKDFLEGKPHGPETAGPTLERGVPARLTVIASDGRVLGDSRGDPTKMENHRTEDRPEVMAALAGRPGADVRQSETLAVEFRYVARPIRHDGKVVGVARIATPVLAILESQAVLREGILWGSLMAVAAFATHGQLDLQTDRTAIPWQRGLDRSLQIGNRRRGLGGLQCMYTVAVQRNISPQAHQVHGPHTSQAHHSKHRAD